MMPPSEVRGNYQYTRTQNGRSLLEVPRPFSSCVFPRIALLGRWVNNAGGQWVSERKVCLQYQTHRARGLPALTASRRFVGVLRPSRAGAGLALDSTYSRAFPAYCDGPRPATVRDPLDNFVDKGGLRPPLPPRIPLLGSTASRGYSPPDAS